MRFKSDTSGNIVQDIPVKLVDPSPFQPRRTFLPSTLEELATSIREHGLIQPISIRKMPGGRYQLISGERRLRACRLLGQNTIRALVIHADDHQAAMLTMIENLQREGLHFFEEAEGYESLVKVHGMTQKEVAAQLHRQQSTIANKIRLLNLSPQVRSAILRNRLTERHARALLRLRDEAKQLSVVEKAAREGLTVQSTEMLICRMLDRESPKPKPEGGMRRLYTDWRLLNNSVRAAVTQMRSAGVPVHYSFRDMGDHVEMRVSVPKTRPSQESVSKAQ
ncbi:MAG: ParB/RepB/Spo0J family partition protein [Clostridiales bacterium]|nr:ParB/RepB/Spo0J family partition protein [Clostridiales bacterium]